MLTIGDFSKLGKVSARMLRHYDIIGLLRPAHVGENGYRYYDEVQLSSLALIGTLKRYGFKLSEIGGLLSCSQEELGRRIHVQRLTVLAEVEALRRTVRQMESDIMQMDKSNPSLDKYHIILMECPPQRVFGLRRTIHISQTHQLFQELKDKMAAQGLTRTGPTQMAYMGEEFDYERMDVEAQAEVAMESEGEGVHTLPGGMHVATTHTGPYEEVKYAYDAICSWMAKHPDYHAAGPGIERYLKDEGMAQSPEELETGVLFRVEKRS